MDVKPIGNRVLIKPDEGEDPMEIPGNLAHKMKNRRMY